MHRSSDLDALRSALLEAQVYLFLDFDGVVVTRASYRRYLEAMWEARYPGRPLPENNRLVAFEAELNEQETPIWRMFDAEACLWVQRFVTVTRAKIVLSTSWRNVYLPEENASFLRLNGIPEAPVGQTPSRGSTRGRGSQIETYCIEHGIDASQIVIAEDEEDCRPYTHRVVRTTMDGPHPGFGKKQFHQALSLVGLTELAVRSAAE